MSIIDLIDSRPRVVSTPLIRVSIRAAARSYYHKKNHTHTHTQHTLVYSLMFHAFISRRTRFINSRNSLWQTQRNAHRPVTCSTGSAGTLPLARPSSEGGTSQSPLAWAGRRGFPSCGHYPRAGRRGFPSRGHCTAARRRGVPPRGLYLASPAAAFSPFLWRKDAALASP
jgi:hypothetical protein